MSVSKPQGTSTGATERLARAIDAATTERRRPTVVGTASERRATSPARTASDAGRGQSEVRGANAAPEPGAGADAARAGAGDVMGSGQPGSTTAARPAPRPTTPYEASMASYAASGSVSGGGGSDVSQQATYEPDHAAAYDAAMAQVGSTPPEGVEPPGSQVEPVGQGAGWNSRWAATFEQLELPPAEIEHLATAGYSDAELRSIARELASMMPLDASGGTAGGTGQPVPGVDAGSVASADGPTGTAWSAEWEQRFTHVMKQMGMDEAAIAEQLRAAQAQPVAEEQLQAAYQQMEQAVGDFDDEWRSKFTQLLTEVKTPAAEQQQVLEQLATSGLADAQLEQAYAQIKDSQPGWNDEWKNKFRALELPKELMTQLEESGAPSSALEQQYQQFLDTKIAYKRDGRLEKLKDAGATPEELWGIMLEGKEGKDFDKLVEQVHSAHVPAWKRIGSLALNLVPGAYAVQYLTGKDWLTGEKIDRSNPLNIVGAVASGFAGFTAVRGAISAVSTAGGLYQGLQGASMLGKTVTGGTQMAANAANQAKNASAVLNAATNGSKAGFQLKALIGTFARFGEVGSIATASRAWGQTASFAASTMAAKNLADGTAAIDKGVRATALESLRSTGGNVAEAMRATSPARKAFEHGAMFADDAAFARSSAATFTQAGGHWTINPFKNRATAEVAGTQQPGRVARLLGRGEAAAATPTAGSAPVISTGRTLDMGSRSGFAIANGTLDGATGIANGRSVVDYARQMGINGSFRSLLQLSQGERAATGAIRAAEGGGTFGYDALHIAGRGARSLGSYAAVPIVGGAAVGMTGKQVQPAWDYYKNRDEIRAKEAAQQELTQAEMAELEQLYAEQQASGQGAASGGAGTAPVAAGDPSAMAMGGTGTEQPVYVDPNTGYYVDPQSGLMADPQSGQVYDQQGNLVGNVNQPAA